MVVLLNFLWPSGHGWVPPPGIKSWSFTAIKLPPKRAFIGELSWGVPKIRLVILRSGPVPLKSKQIFWAQLGIWAVPGWDFPFCVRLSLTKILDSSVAGPRRAAEGARCHCRLSESERRHNRTDTARDYPLSKSRYEVSERSQAASRECCQSLCLRAECGLAGFWLTLPYVLSEEKPSTFKLTTRQTEFQRNPTFSLACCEE